ncbi:flagellar hook-basal body protein [Lachnospiraceae bacterium ZAX-1]
MVKGLYTAYTGMINQQNRLDVLTNNLANSATNGFKKEGATSQSFEDELAIKLKDTSDMGIPKRLGIVNLGVKIGECYTNYDQGAFRVTDNVYDIGLDGNGFFALAFTNKQGETSVKYSRDGAFTATREGYLVTKDGDYVLNQAGATTANPGAANYIQIDPNVKLVIDEQGYLYQNNVQIGQLGVVDFQDYNYLGKYGENMYELVEGGQVQASNAKVVQGTLEMSNVNVVSEMVEMITISRAYEANQKIIQTIDSTLDKAVNGLGKL